MRAQMNELINIPCARRRMQVPAMCTSRMLQWRKFKFIFSRLQADCDMCIGMGKDIAWGCYYKSLLLFSEPVGKLDIVTFIMQLGKM
jgi:hypothetical protein